MLYSGYPPLNHLLVLNSFSNEHLILKDSGNPISPNDSRFLEVHCSPFVTKINKKILILFCICISLLLLLYILIATTSDFNLYSKRIIIFMSYLYKNTCTY